MMFTFKTLEALLIVCTVLGYIAYYIKRKYEYWKDRNVPHLGASKDFVFLHHSQMHRTQIYDDLYRNYSSDQYVGFYLAGKPILMIRDLKLIRAILIKDFSHFTDHGLTIIDGEPLFAKSLFNIGGHQWRRFRSKITPIFTSGRLKRMSGPVSECTEKLEKYLETVLEKSGDVQIEVREIILRFAMDTVGACTLGLNCEAIEDENSTFTRMARQLFQVSSNLKSLFCLILDTIHPKLNSWLRIKFTTSEVRDFFFSLTRDTIKYREGNATKREDLIQHLLNLRNEEQQMRLQGQKEHSDPLFDETGLVANATLFFIAGFEPIASTVSYALYELAKHPDIMATVYEEIMIVKQFYEGNLTYEAYKHMVYMDCVLFETLRMHSHNGWLDRVCTQTYQVPGTNLIIEKNTNVIIPVASVHHDPTFYPEPEKFDPERFNEENRFKIPSCAFLPFGEGPRICIGMRFAWMEMKAALSVIIGKYIVEPTNIPIHLNPLGHNNAPRAVYLRLKRREKWS